MRLQVRHLKERETDHEFLWSFIGLLTIGGIVGWVALVGAPPVGCAFHNLTGRPCVTCGATRSLLAIAHGQVWTAVQLNPLMALAWGAWIAWIPYGLTTWALQLPRLRMALERRDLIAVRIAAPLALALNWIWLIVDGR